MLFASKIMSRFVIVLNVNTQKLSDRRHPALKRLTRLPFHTHLEEGDALQHAGGAAHLSDGVHGELRRSDIQHRDAEAGGQDGPDGGPTRAVVTDHHILQEEGSKPVNLS